MNNEIIVLSGFSGAGKDSIAEMFKDVGYNFVVLHSTRAMRANESEGNPYHFISVDEFQEMSDRGEFIEERSYVTEFNGINDTAYYGIAHEALLDDRPYIVVLGVQAMTAFMKVIGPRATSVFIHVDDEIREERAKARGSFDQIEWDNRLAQDNKKFPKGCMIEGADMTVKNHNTAFDTFNKIVSLLDARSKQCS